MISFFIIVPTLDSYTLLSALLDSIKQQTYPYWRVHFIDGQSGKDHIAFLEEVCKHDKRFCWSPQLSTQTGIFGAMNEGIKYADTNNHWLLFWGSDDQASSPLMLASIASKLEAYRAKNDLPDLLVCEGIYFHQGDDTLTYNNKFFGRTTRFILRHSFRRSLFLGSTPPHQATFFGPGALALIPNFTTDMKLAADLDYFLNLSQHPGIKVYVEDETVVWIGDSGVSNRKTSLRLKEVKRSYRKAFGYKWWIPFVSRYLQRINSLIKMQ
jgi:glycosyltransferase involved in cell wall biosynthesis